MKAPQRIGTMGKRAPLRWLFLILMVLFGLGVSSCWHPPFNADISASEFTVSKLGDPVWAVSINLSSEASGGYYLPYRDPSEYYHGAWVWKSSSQIRFGYLTITGPTAYTFSTSYNSFPNEMGNAAQIRTPMGANTAYNYVFFGSSGNNGIVQYLLSTTMPAYWSPTPPPAVGMGMVPDTTTNTNDWFYIAFFSEGILNYSYQQINSGSTFPPSPSGGAFTHSVPVPVAPGFFAQSPANGGFYLSAKMASGAYETFYWSSIAAVPVRLPVTVQITGMLSDGRLLADSSSSLSVYSPTGDYLFTINTGALRLVHERFDSVNTCWISVFSRTVAIPQQNSDNDQYLIQIYEIKTQNLRDLAR